jgi:hypothetical protein
LEPCYAIDKGINPIIVGKLEREKEREREK